MAKTKKKSKHKEGEPLESGEGTYHAPHIKESHEGRFSAFARGRDESVQQAASYVLSHKGEFSESREKQAQFAKNASKWGNGHPG